MNRYLLILSAVLSGLAFSGCPPAPEPVQATPPENLGIVINKYTNGFWIRQMGTAEGDTVELLVTQKALDARGIILKDFSPQSSDGVFDNGGGFVFNASYGLWSSLRGGTFLVLSWTTDAPRSYGDTLITAGLRNTDAFTPARSGTMNLYNIGNEDLLMLRRNGEQFSGTGACIHAFAVGISRSKLDSLNLTNLVNTNASAQANGASPYAVAKTSGRMVSDFGRRDDAETRAVLPLGWGRAHSVENQAVVGGVRKK
jgi:hypothetical protein